MSDLPETAETKIVIVSACLVGMKTRYDATDAINDAVFNGNEILLPLCPEELGGLPTPRPPAEIDPKSADGTDVLEGAARVIDSNNNDVTKEFLAGAEKILEIARLVGARQAFLKEGSPSCGLNIIKRAGKTEAGVGVLAALLKRNGIEIRSF